MLQKSRQEHLRTRLILAPMESVTDRVFRAVVAKACEMAGQEKPLFFTEFTNVSSYASEKGRQNALERLEICPTDQPIIAQIWGKNPEHFAETARVLDKLGFQGLDINMGCPDRHVNKAGGGAAMIKTPELAIECIKRAKENTTLPVSVKTRLGFTTLDECHEWLKTLLEQDLAMLTVHLRTRKEMSKVDAHFELIPEIIQLRNTIAPNTKLIINGDVKDKAQADELLAKYPELDGIMIGRGVFDNPFCFATDPNDPSKPYQPTAEELKILFLFHLDQFDQYSRQPFVTIKHFYKVYFKGDKQFRNRLMEAKTTDELRQIVENH